MEDTKNTGTMRALQNMREDSMALIVNATPMEDSNTKEDFMLKMGWIADMTATKNTRTMETLKTAVAMNIIMEGIPEFILLHEFLVEGFDNKVMAWVAHFRGHLSVDLDKILTLFILAEFINYFL